MRSAAFLFVLSLPLCLCVFQASHDPCVASTVGSAWVRARLRREEVTRGDKRSKSAMLRPFQLISLNLLRAEGLKKRGFDWQVAIKMLPTPPIRFSVYPVYGSPNEQWLCAGVFFPLLPFLYFTPVVLSLPRLALTLCQYHHPRLRQRSTRICLHCRL